MPDELIRGKVARILNSREVALNIGADAGVATGMYFDILDPKGEDIRDPDTDDVLGSVDRPKVRVQVVKVLGRLCVASTYKKKRVNVGGMGFGAHDDFTRVLAPPKYVTLFETLRTTEKTWEDLAPEQSYVKVGDPVVQVVSPLEGKDAPDG